MWSSVNGQLAIHHVNLKVVEAGESRGPQCVGGFGRIG